MLSKLSFLAMLRDHFRLNGTSGENKMHHLLFVLPSSKLSKNQNASNWSTKDYNWFQVTLPSFRHFSVLSLRQNL
jgi:hypothetical protein